MKNKETEPEQIPAVQTSSKKKKTIFIVTIVGIGVALLLGFLSFYFFSTKNVTQNFNQASELSTPFSGPTPTPKPFSELTIPYLRNRSYQSKLHERSIAYKGQNYTGYLTSYDSDGLKINGLLTIPNGKEPSGGWPAIVFVHGYIPPASYETTQNYYSYVDYLARNEFVVFKIDLRGHGQSEGEPGGAYYSSDYVIDTLNAYAALKSLGVVNPKKIGLWGHSMAGNVVFRSLVVGQTIPAAAIWAGAVYSYEDFQKYQIQDGSYQPPPTGSPRLTKRQILFNTYGEFKKDSLFWKEVSPINFLSGIEGAVQVNHAVDDSVVNIGYSRDLMKILDSTSIIHSLNEYDSGGHNIEGKNFVPAMETTVSFFKEYLEAN